CGFSIVRWVALKQAQYGFFRTWSGVGDLQQSSSVVQLAIQEVGKKATLLVEYFHVPCLVLFPIALAVGLIALWRSRRRPASIENDAAFPASIVLLGAGLTHLLWWLALDREGWYRHLLPGTLYLAVLGSFLAAAAFRRSRVLGCVTVALLLLSWAPRWTKFQI